MPVWIGRRRVLGALPGACVAGALVVTAVACTTSAGPRPGGGPSVSVTAPATASPGARGSNAADGPGSNLANLPVNTALTGSAAIAWGKAALVALGAPATRANVRTMVDWFANEGTPHDFNNPLNLQTPYGGSVTSTADGDPASIHIQAYPAPADFAAAFPLEMNSGSYPAIVAALKAGTGLEGPAATHEIAAELLLYSGEGYDSIPAAYNR